MHSLRVARSAGGLSRVVGFVQRHNGQLTGSRGIVGGYNEDTSNLPKERTATSGAKKGSPPSRDEFPEFKVESGQAQSVLHSTDMGKMYISKDRDESFAFQLPVTERHSIVRDYHDETGELKQKWDVGQENMERTFRNDTGHVVEERREKEIKTTGFPEAFHPRPFPHGDKSALRNPEPIPRRADEMHLPTSRKYNLPDR